MSNLKILVKVILCVGLGVWILWQYDTYNVITNKIIDLEKKNTSLNARATTKIDLLEDRLNNFGDIIEIRKKLSKIQKQYKKVESLDVTQLKIIQSQYTSQLADFFLNQLGEYKLAEKLLIQASRNISSLESNNYKHLQQALQLDLENVRKKQPATRLLVWEKVGHLLELVSGLPLRSATFKYEHTNRPAKKTISWQEQLKYSLDKFKDLIKINNNSENISLLIYGEDLIKERLRFLLEQIRLGCLFNEEDIFLGTIIEANKYLQKYFVATDINVIKINDSLTRLQQFKLQKIHYDLQASLRAFQELETVE